MSLAKQQKELGPHITYSKLLYLASGCEAYKSQYSVWPTNIDQLRSYRPDLVEATKDTYGHDVVFVPYNEALGYGALISYGRDGRPGGNNEYDLDIVIRFPSELETNTIWNNQVGRQIERHTPPLFK
jgi:hypothetical protein